MKNVNKKLLIVTVVALVLAVSCVVGTFAYLAVYTKSVVNTFTSGNITLSLTETGASEQDGKLAKSYKITPGAELSKDPEVVVAAGSEDCYVFIKVIESNKFDTTNVFEYTIDESVWTPVDGEDGVYYHVFEASELTDGVLTAEETLNVITDQKVVIKTTATSEDIAAAAGATLTFTAYAVQKGAGDVAAAWAVADGLDG